MDITCIIHIYNEEYLLPFWLTYHKDIFAHGIIIDYQSTDRSVEICKNICPHWEIRQSANHSFGACAVDREVQDIEKTIDGFKIVLNVTEYFIPINASLTTCDKQHTALKMHVYAPYSLPESEFYPKDLKEFFNSMANEDVRFHIAHDRGYRIIHNHPEGKYNFGRHFSHLNPVHTDDYLIIWTGFYPMNEKMLARKLQIKDKIPLSDKIAGHGGQHMMDKAQMIQKNFQKYNIGKHIKHLNEKLYQYLLLF